MIFRRRSTAPLLAAAVCLTLGGCLADRAARESVAPRRSFPDAPPPPRRIPAMPSPTIPRGVSTTLLSDPDAAPPRPDGYPSLWRLSPGLVLIFQLEPEGGVDTFGWTISTDINFPAPGSGDEPFVTNDVFPPLDTPAGDYEWRAVEAGTGLPGSVRFTLAPLGGDGTPCDKPPAPTLAARPHLTNNAPAVRLTGE